MRYIKSMDISPDLGRVFRYSPDNQHMFYHLQKSVIHDLKSGEDEPWRGSYTDLLGFSNDGYERVFMLYEEKEAILHKYISVSMAERGHLEGDFIAFGGGSVLESSDKRCLNIGLTSFRASTVGYNGSIVYLRDNRTLHESIISTYQFLAQTCRELSTNPLVYKALKFNGPMYTDSIIMILKQTAEAKRFFTKMWLDCRVGDY